ncbi:MAG: hypothetical protein A2Z27_05700 [candidate division Zixibacteria bacterium RBG_16_50_21]|nr:MAG: hypothetical protein A2Z27_05700 [candidate division Zixibacteria bacterium RBG_16_50_21]
MKLKIKWKFFGGIFTVCLLGLVLVGLLISRLTEKLLLQQIEESLKSETQLISNQLQQQPLVSAEMGRIDSLTDQLAEKVTARVTIISADGQVLGDSYKSGQELLQLENHLHRPEVQEALRSRFGKNVRFSTTARMKMFYLAFPIRQKGEIKGFARLALPLTQLAKQQTQITKAVGIAILITLVLSLTLSLFLAGRLTRPLKNMTESARRIAQGDFQMKIKLRTQDEVSELAHYFNQMVQQLEITVTELMNEKSQLDSIVSNLKEGVLALNSKGEILIANESVKEMFGWHSPVFGRRYVEIIRHPFLNGLIKKAMLEKKNQSSEIDTGFPQEKVLLTEILTLDTQSVDQVSVILVFFDITRLKRLEKIRKDFVANASHELRTPLTSIKGYVEALQDGALNEADRAKNFLNIVQRQADRMGKIIADLLLLSQIEAEDYRLKAEEFSLKELINEIATQFRKSAEDKSQKIEVKFTATNDNIQADRDKLTQVLVNLIDNAIKYTGNGGLIQITAEERAGKMIVSVKDNGIGIPSTEVPRIFERFYTVDKARSRELGGTGLGLSIVKHIVEVHGGEVWVESELGKGSIFYFSLPV